MNRDYLKPRFPIREAAKILNVSVHTLRMYEREGLILPYQKPTKHRLYSLSDIDRLKCIRETINEKKISISGIKTILSMVPCWKIINCSRADRNNCQAYAESLQPCWSYMHKNNICADLRCTDCKVYIEYSDCQKIKESIKMATL